MLLPCCSNEGRDTDIEKKKMKSRIARAIGSIATTHRKKMNEQEDEDYTKNLSIIFYYHHHHSSNIRAS